MADQLDLVFTAIANPTRRAILDRLAHGEATVTEIAAPFALSQPTITAHLKVLEAAGLIRRGKRANFRPVSLSPMAFQQAHLWIDQYARFWSGGLERLEDFATSLAIKEDQDGPE